VAEKGRILAEVVGHVWPLIAEKKVRPVIHATYPLAEVARAHQDLEESSHIGKVLLTL
jgi:NADPH:quinone reductase-like Zn-dependent oxidoreductase